jgi:hypothetical protein
MNRRTCRLIAPLALFALLLVGTASVQAAPQETAQATEATEVAPVEPGSKVLALDDYNRWRTVEGTTISADGRWTAFGYETRRQADAELHIRSLDGDADHVIERGSGAVLSDDGRWAIYRIALGWEELEAAEKEGTPTPVQAQLRDLDSGETWTWDDVASFQIARGGRAVAVRRNKSDKDAEHNGTDLIVRYLSNGSEELLGSVEHFAFNKPGTHLAYTVDAADDNGNGLYLIDLTTGNRRSLDNAKEDYARLAWSENGKALAALRGSKPEGMDERANVLVAFPAVTAEGTPDRITYEPSADADFPADFVVSERGGVRWNDTATQVFFGIKEQRPEPEKTDEPISDVNVFHWADDRIQSVQAKQAGRDRDFTYLSVLNLDAATFVQLGTERLRRFEVVDQGRYAIGFDSTDYVSDWKPRYSDIYRVDTHTGEVAPMLTRQLRTYGLSPDGQNFLYWSNGAMWNWRVAESTQVNLTESAGVSFVNEEFDYFGEKPAYGVAGWTSDGAGVLLNHRYDIWQVKLDGSGGANLTAGYGTEHSIRLRHLQLDPDAKTIDLSQPQMLAGYGEWTKKAGFYWVEEGGSRPFEMLWADKIVGRPIKARDAARIVFTIQAFHQFPDYWATEMPAQGEFAWTVDAHHTPYGDDNGDDPTTSFSFALTQVTDANPQHAEYKWGKRILFDYTNSDGVPLQGTLAIPDDYVAGEKRPMIVRFYEKYSQDLHRYPTVRYRHEPNFGDYVSNGYLVMQPDIHFRGGSSHSDMLECVEAATRKVIEMGYAEPTAIGLSGHSYSGGGSSYIAARSDMFAAVASGAAPINLTSEFNQLFLGTGGNNHSYDIYGQGRYGTNPYDDPEIYAYESPITWVRDMDTPLLYLHGEEDQIVGYVQGMEWYNALRYNAKPVIFLSYPDEGHGLRKFENQYDFQTRLHQFFDHHLRDELPAPWMVNGVPYLDKERNLRRREGSR